MNRLGHYKKNTNSCTAIGSQSVLFTTAITKQHGTAKWHAFADDNVVSNFKLNNVISSIDSCATSLPVQVKAMAF